MKKLILIDDHVMLRTGIASWFFNNSDWQIALQCENFDQLKNQINSLKIEKNDFVIAVVDLTYKTKDSKVEEETGWEIVKYLNNVSIPSIIFSSHDSGTYIERAMSKEIMAKGFVSKTSQEKVLLEAVEMIYSGKTFIQPDLFSSFVEAKSILNALTIKEREIARMVLHNMDNEEIAQKMNLKIHTVENYITKIYDKTGTSSRREFIELVL